MLLVAGGTERGAHDAGVARAAGAIVVAHLRRCREAPPFGPIQCRLDRQLAIIGLEAEEAAIVHLRRPDNLAGVEEALWVESVLDLLEGADHARAEHCLVKLGADETVAVLARMRALIFANHRE